jgi:hypothetical protein
MDLIVTFAPEPGSFLSKSVESGAHKKEPSRGEQGISDYGDAEAREREDPKGTGAQCQIRRDFIECSSQHYETDQENPRLEGHDCIHDFQRGVEHCGSIVGGRDITRPMGVVPSGSVVSVESKDRGVMRPRDCQIQDNKQPHECSRKQHYVSVELLQRQVQGECNWHVKKVCEHGQT